MSHHGLTTLGSLISVPIDGEGCVAGGVGAVAGEFPSIGGDAVAHGCAGEEVDWNCADVIRDEFREVVGVAVVSRMELFDGAGEGGLADASLGADDGDSGFGKVRSDVADQSGVW